MRTLPPPTSGVCVTVVVGVGAVPNLWLMCSNGESRYMIGTIPDKPDGIVHVVLADTWTDRVVLFKCVELTVHLQ